MTKQAERRRKMPAQSELKYLFDYDPETGVFIRRVNSGTVGLAGAIAGYLRPDEYVTISVKGDTYSAHRLAWIYMTGEPPKECIDHINHVKNDNRFCNLREATNKENTRSAVMAKNNTSGRKGVVWHKVGKKYQAQIMVNGKQMWLGLFDDIEEASAAYETKAKELFGEFYLRNGESPAS
tara:strand:+ start:708 stop:1247 length:540 start_codon:yes stop_codon:yes gene_type:complete